MGSSAGSKTLIAQLLSAATIELRLRAKSREALFGELIGKIPGIRDRPDAAVTLLKAVKEREQMHSTGLGDGVAIPHARNAIPGVTDHTVIVFGRQVEGIDYGAIDGRPVHLFFLLIAPTISEHLQTLAALSRLLRDAPLRRDLLEVTTPEEALARLRRAESG